MRRLSGAWIGLGSALLLILLAVLVPLLTGWNVHIKSFPPLHADLDVRLGPGTIPAIALGILAILYASRLSASAPWRLLLVGSFVVAAAWLASLALVDGLDGLGAILDHRTEYLQTARGVTNLLTTLHEYVSRIPLDSAHHWPIHIAGHPAGALVFFWVLVQAGLGSWLTAGIVVTLIAATTPVAVLITMRRLGAEAQARTVAPFLVIGPAAIWMSVSADGMFTAVAAWGLCCLALAATARSRIALAGWAIGAGLLLGYCVMLSYGLPLLGVLAIAVLVAGRRWWPLPWAFAGAILVILGFAAAGFQWWEAYPALVGRYWDGIASDRPIGYWIWANLAALAFSAGPIVGASIGAAVQRARVLRERVQPERVVVLLVLAAAASILLADLSGMSKAEVERIWLPFVPWLLIGIALLPARWRYWAFAGQVIFALLAQHLLRTTW